MFTAYFRPGIGSICVFEYGNTRDAGKLSKIKVFGDVKIKGFLGKDTSMCEYGGCFVALMFTSCQQYITMGVPANTRFKSVISSGISLFRTASVMHSVVVTAVVYVDEKLE